MTTTFQPTLAFIGNFGGGEIILIFLIVLLLFGAKKVPELFRSLGKGVNEFRKAKNEWEQDIQDVELQGDRRAEALEWLRAMGFHPVLAGG